MSLQLVIPVAVGVFALAAGAVVGFLFGRQERWIERRRAVVRLEALRCELATCITNYSNKWNIQLPDEIVNASDALRTALRRAMYADNPFD